MGFYYRSVGFTTQVGKLYPECTSKVQLINSTGTVCGTSQNNADVLPDIAALVLPKYEATRNQKVLYTSALGDQNSTTVASEYFGSMYTSDLVPPPATSVLGLGSWRLKNSTKKKTFEEAKKRGDIILNPLDIYAASATIVPGIKGVYANPFRTQFQRGQGPDIERRYSAPCSRNGYVYPSHLPLLGNFLVPAHNVWCVYDRFTVPSGGDPWYVASDDEVWDLLYLLRGAVEDTDYQGLVTANLAAANNSNLDVLTNLSELPETAKFVLGVLKTILGLVTDFRKESAAIRNRYYRAVHDTGRKRDPTLPGQLMDDLSSLWLQYRYALMPLIYTVEDALGILLRGEVEYRSFRMKERRYPTVTHADWNIDEFEVLDRCFIKYRFEFDSDSYTSNSNFLTTNPALTLWELTKLSFVVDWVFNIGDLLASLDTPEGVTQIKAMVSSRIKSTIICRHKRHPGAEIHLHLGRYIAKPIQPMQYIG